MTAILVSYGAKVIGISDNKIKNSHLNYLGIKKIKEFNEMYEMKKITNVQNN